MNDFKYRDWITSHVKSSEDAYGKCEIVTLEMQQAFPELKRVKGHYYCSAWGERTHWWLVTPDGRIVDPTASQFPSNGSGQYVELDPNDPVPIGKCLNCGELVYEPAPREDICSYFCYGEFIESLM